MVWSSLEIKYDLLVVDILLPHFALLIHLLLPESLGFVYQVWIHHQEFHYLGHHLLSENEFLMSMIMVVR
jgi:hypothetical protein